MLSKFLILNICYSYTKSNFDPIYTKNDPKIMQKRTFCNDRFTIFFLYDKDSAKFINPIPAGVLENQDMLRGRVNLTPPLNPMFDVQI